MCIVTRRPFNNALPLSHCEFTSEVAVRSTKFEILVQGIKTKNPVKNVKPKEFSYDISIQDVNDAATEGNVVLLEHLFLKGCRYIRSDEDTIMYDSNERQSSTHVSIALSAAENGQEKVLEWYRSKGFKWGKWTCRGAAGQGNLKTLKYLRRNECPWGINTLNEACENGYIHVIEWAVQNGCTLDELSLIGACKANKKDILEFAFNHAIPRNGCWLCAAAASAGHFELLVLLRENGCAWNETTLYAAFNNNYLNILIWALDNSCPTTDVDISRFML